MTSPDLDSSPTPTTHGGPPERTILHIGSFKTGTSFLQSVLLRNRERLAEEGVYYPTSGGSWSLQTGAIKDLLARDQPDTVNGAWGKLVKRVLDCGLPTALISVERLSLASPDHTRALVESFRPSEVHVVLTLRDLGRVLPSDWQSKVKQGREWTFPSYLSAASTEDGGPAAARRVFWQHHDGVDVATRWLHAVPPERLHVVTVPPSGSPASLLWERFSSVVGIDPDRYDITQDSKSNFSLSFSDTEFLRQINEAVGRTMSSESRKRWMTKYLANKLLRPDSSDLAREDRPRLGTNGERWAAERSAELVAKLRQFDLDVVGDLDELLSRPTAPAGASPDPSDPSIPYPERAAELIAALLRKLAEVDEARRTGKSIATAKAKGTRTGRGHAAMAAGQPGETGEGRAARKARRHAVADTGAPPGDLDTKREARKARRQAAGRPAVDRSRTDQPSALRAKRQANRARRHAAGEST